MASAAGLCAPLPPRWPFVPPPRRGGLGTPNRPRRWPCHWRLLHAAVAGYAALVHATATPAPPLVTPSDRQEALGCAAIYQNVRGPALTVPRARLLPAGPEEAAVFRAVYGLLRGSGTLTRAALVRDADGELRLTAPRWDAARLLALHPPALRQIYTYDPAGVTVPFLWDRISPLQQALLDRPPGDPTAPGDGMGPARLDFLRGVRDLEGQGLRTRAGVLGDAVHGTPVYAGASLNTVAHARADAGYQAFHRATLRRIPAVYLGTNDGMLHAFDARTGAELFAYVPDMLFGALGALTAPGYRHRAYVDGPLAIGEARIANGWRTVLVGTPGAGGQGLFALDVTNPAAFGHGLGVLWEFTEHDDPALGHVLAPVTTARLHVGTTRGTRRYRHFALAGNGVDSDALDEAPGPHGAALFLLALDKGPGEAWERDTNYYRFDLPGVEAGLPAGLSAPALVVDEDNTLRHAYAGDLQGNLWRFDFTRLPPWRTNGGPRPLFVAQDRTGARQPIAQQPKVVHAADGGYLVLFGTGMLVSRQARDPAGFAVQSFYAVYDDPAGQADARPRTRADLLERVLRPSPGDAAAGFAVTGRQQAIGTGTRPKGWFVDFADSAATGERSSGAAALADGKVVFNTVVPGADPCAESASRTYLLDALSGLASDGAGMPVAGGVTGMLAPDFFDGAAALLPATRSRGAREPGGLVRVARSTDVVNLGARGALRRGPSSRVTLPAGRLSWREVANWRQLHSAAAPRAGSSDTVARKEP